MILLDLNVPVPVTVDTGSEGEVTCADAWKLRDPNPSPNIRFTSSRFGKDSSDWKLGGVGRSGEAKKTDSERERSVCVIVRGG
ncbi:hypothetical protein AHAS_Ahas04G0205800 [Arachis hypogaea]